ncbi:MAG: winged helix-turn-helix domain-containing protein, partial [Pseudomonadales bacterium]
EPRELVARIQSVLRRATGNGSLPAASQQPGSASHILRANGLIVDCDKRSATLDGETLELTTMEYELLCIFMQSPGKTFNRDELMNAIRGINADLYSRAMDTLVSRLRHKLADTNKTPRFIRTVWGRGYAFLGDSV